MAPNGSTSRYIRGWLAGGGLGARGRRGWTPRRTRPGCPARRGPRRWRGTVAHRSLERLEPATRSAAGSRSRPPSAPGSARPARARRLRRRAVDGRDRADDGQLDARAPARAEPAGCPRRTRSPPRSPTTGALRGRASGDTWFAAKLSRSGSERYRGDLATTPGCLRAARERGAGASSAAAAADRARRPRQRRPVCSTAARPSSSATPSTSARRTSASAGRSQRRRDPPRRARLPARRLRRRVRSTRRPATLQDVGVLQSTYWRASISCSARATARSLRA